MCRGEDITSYTDINLQTKQDTVDNGAILNFIEQIHNGETDATDVNGLLKYLSVSAALSNLDSYHGTLALNYYIRQR